MASASHEREQELFHACLELSAGEREAYLERACGGDALLRERVARLLLAHSRARGETLRPLQALHEGDPPDLVGPYRLTGLLGEGGMGVVYEAEQLEPLRRRVALKVVKLGMDTKQVVARFMTERQALAAMDHPYVARVFDAGQTVAGRPYFVMERVDGVPLLEYCDLGRLPVDRRLELFARVCQAVQHAHQKGVIHRDLKPSNVLVSTADGVAIPKIIDFGIAKAVGLDVPGAVTDFTRTGQALGTPAYMSPEQAGRGPDVDTRTDVYSLGVILYELLTGRLPADPAETGYGEFLAALARAEVEPVRPSVRAANADDGGTEAAAKRASTPAGLKRRLQGDLDWVVTKALEPDRTRRYDTAAALAEDVLRHLRDEPVLAGPPSRTYRLRKLVRRHRTPVAAAAVALVALVAGAAVAATQAVRATRAERASRAEAETARQVAGFLVGLFEVSDPGVARGSTITARELLDRGAERIHEDLGEQLLVRARLQTVIGEIYRKLGLYDEARPLLAEALADRERLLGPDDLEVVRTIHALGRLDNDRGEPDAAEEAFRTALSRLSSAARKDPVEEARVRCQLANVLREKARYDEAEPLLRQALEALTRELGPTHRDVGAAFGDLGSTLMHTGRLAEAESAFRSALAVLEESLGSDHPERATTMVNLSTALARLGRYDEAEEHLLRAIAIDEKAYGPEHPVVGAVLNNLASLYGRLGRYDEAETVFERALAVRERSFGPGHPETSIALMNLGLTRMYKAEYEKSLRTLERALAIGQEARGAEHPQTALTRGVLGELHRRRGDLDAAEDAYGRALAAIQKTFGERHPHTVLHRLGLGRIALQSGRLAVADALLAETLSIAEKASPSNPDIPQVLDALGELRLRQGRLVDAREALERSRSLEDEALPPGHPDRVRTSVLLAEVLAAEERPAEAEALLRQALAIAESAHGPDHPDVADALHALGTVLLRRNDEEAASCLERALAVRRARLGRRHPDALETARVHASVGSSGPR